nr:immunoglobulin heavy chain junction region [Mus musculus]
CARGGYFYFFDYW